LGAVAVKTKLFAVEGRCEEVPLSWGERSGSGEAVVLAHPQGYVLSVQCEIPGKLFRWIAKARDQGWCLQRFGRFYPTVERPGGIGAQDRVGLHERLLQAIAVGQEHCIKRAVEGRIVRDLRLGEAAYGSCHQAARNHCR